jgi:endonuclease/exonuclease/phosphatase family metal-dependent hydrolase
MRALTSPPRPGRAPTPRGWLLSLLATAAALLLAACEKSASPAAPETPAATPAETAVSPPSTDATQAAAEPTPSPERPAADPAAPPVSPSTAGLRFIAYNVENWLTMDRRVQNQTLPATPKPEEEKAAAITLLHRHAPDIVGLCEIGTAADLAEIQQRLKQAGTDLPHLHYSGGSDEVRHLGLLSRFPITSTAKPAETSFSLQGRTYHINRGILDATVEARGQSFRFLGVHLKSKREVDEFDQEEMRVQEAHLLRRHVDSILAENPDARLVVYGDFNDTRPSAAFRTATGTYNSPGYLTAIPAKDRNGHSWTHHWSYQDIYSRIDFVTVSRALRRETDFQASRILDDPEWSAASDHRPILAIFREPQNQR